MIGVLVREAILMRRAEQCTHEWKRLNELEEQCQKCTIIVTEAGKKHLEALRRGKQNLA